MFVMDVYKYKGKFFKIVLIKGLFFVEAMDKRFLFVRKRFIFMSGLPAIPALLT